MVFCDARLNMEYACSFTAEASIHGLSPLAELTDPAGGASTASRAVGSSQILLSQGPVFTPANTADLSWSAVIIHREEF